MVSSPPVHLLLTCVLLFYAGAGKAANCLYVSSYHQGYEWNDGIERGIDKTLAGKCKVDKFYMDTNRNKTPEYASEIALKAKQYIDQSKPDVVIACDDNASKYLVQPYFKDAKLPIVFCGINWTVEPYGYPYSNVTGMIEISPINPLIKELKASLHNPRKGIYLASDSTSQRKEYELNKQTYAKQKMDITPRFVKTMAEWEEGFRQSQTAEFIILGNEGGINDWNEQRAKDTALRHAKKLIVTNYEWMAPIAMLAMTKLAEEQGEWSALTALHILKGAKPSQIPIVVNRRWNSFVNPALLNKAGITLSPRILRNSIKIGD